MSTQTLIDALESSTRLEGWGKKLSPIAEKLTARPEVRDALTGRSLGHPAHPMMVVAPLSCWLSTTVLDLVGGRAARRAANRLCFLGVVAALPTAAAGAADWRDTDGAEQRVGTAHALVNSTALVLYALSMRRRRRAHARTLLLSLAGATVATVGGYLGGHLAYRRGVGVATTAFAAGPTDWKAIGAQADFADGKMTRRDVDGVPLVVLPLDGKLWVFEDRCTHRGGPLDEGELDGTRVTCPWHGSVFDVRDGHVVRGPASAPQPVYDVRLRDDQVEVRRIEPGSLRVSVTR